MIRRLRSKVSLARLGARTARGDDGEELLAPPSRSSPTPTPALTTTTTNSTTLGSEFSPFFASPASSSTAWGSGGTSVSQEADAALPRSAPKLGATEGFKAKDSQHLADAAVELASQAAEEVGKGHVGGGSGWDEAVVAFLARLGRARGLGAPDPSCPHLWPVWAAAKRYPDLAPLPRTFRVTVTQSRVGVEGRDEAAEEVTDRGHSAAESEGRSCNSTASVWEHACTGNSHKEEQQYEESEEEQEEELLDLGEVRTVYEDAWATGESRRLGSSGRVSFPSRHTSVISTTLRPCSTAGSHIDMAESKVTSSMDGRAEESLHVESPSDEVGSSSEASNSEKEDSAKSSHPLPRRDSNHNPPSDDGCRNVEIVRTTNHSVEPAHLAGFSTLATCDDAVGMPTSTPVTPSGLAIPLSCATVEARTTPPPCMATNEVWSPLMAPVASEPLPSLVTSPNATRRSLEVTMSRLDVARTPSAHSAKPRRGPSKVRLFDVGDRSRIARRRMARRGGESTGACAAQCDLETAVVHEGLGGGQGPDRASRAVSKWLMSVSSGSMDLRASSEPSSPSQRKHDLHEEDVRHQRQRSEQLWSFLSPLTSAGPSPQTTRVVVPQTTRVVVPQTTRLVPQTKPGSFPRASAHVAMTLVEPARTSLRLATARTRCAGVEVRATASAPPSPATGLASVTDEAYRAVGGRSKPRTSTGHGVAAPDQNSPRGPLLVSEQSGQESQSQAPQTIHGGGRRTPWSSMIHGFLRKVRSSPALPGVTVGACSPDRRRLDPETHGDTIVGARARAVLPRRIAAPVDNPTPRFQSPATSPYLGGRQYGSPDLAVGPRSPRVTASHSPDSTPRLGSSSPGHPTLASVRRKAVPRYSRPSTGPASLRIQPAPARSPNDDVVAGSERQVAADAHGRGDGSESDEERETEREMASLDGGSEDTDEASSSTWNRRATASTTTTTSESSLWGPTYRMPTVDIEAMHGLGIPHIPTAWPSRSTSSPAPVALLTPSPLLHAVPLPLRDAAAEHDEHGTGLQILPLPIGADDRTSGDMEAGKETPTVEAAPTAMSLYSSDTSEAVTAPEDWDDGHSSVVEWSIPEAEIGDERDARCQPTSPPPLNRVWPGSRRFSLLSAYGLGQPPRAVSPDSTSSEPRSPPASFDDDAHRRHAAPNPTQMPTSTTLLHVPSNALLEEREVGGAEEAGRCHVPNTPVPTTPGLSSTVVGATRSPTSPLATAAWCVANTAGATAENAGLGIALLDSCDTLWETTSPRSRAAF